jgi:hypothetical protein
MFLNNENIKKEKRERKGFIAKACKWLVYVKQYSHEHGKLPSICLIEREREGNIKASSGGANGSKELIDNQVNDDEIVQADAWNKNNDKVEEWVKIRKNIANMRKRPDHYHLSSRCHDNLLLLLFPISPDRRKRRKSRHVCKIVAAAPHTNTFIMRRRMFSLNKMLPSFGKKPSVHLSYSIRSPLEWRRAKERERKTSASSCFVLISLV